ncbi:UNVERIFIED_CONTAM: hypothetical protein GTU68_029079 [Idotea baltica]|nr:hypothetical protein [Idotea baltica]
MALTSIGNRHHGLAIPAFLALGMVAGNHAVQGQRHRRRIGQHPPHPPSFRLGILPPDRFQSNKFHRGILLRHHWHTACLQLHRYGPGLHDLQPPLHGLSPPFWSGQSPTVLPGSRRHPRQKLLANPHLRPPPQYQTTNPGGIGDDICPHHG